MARAVIVTDFAGEGGFSRPAGAYRIATELRKHGYTTQVIDHFTDIVRDSIEPFKALVDKYVDADTLIFGFSSTFFVDVRSSERDPEVRKELSKQRFFGVESFGYPLTLEEMWEIISWVKARAPKAKIVMGGAKASYRMSPGVDVYVFGYADSSIVDLVRWIDGKNPFFRFRVLDGAIILDTDVKATNFDFTHSQIRWEAEDHIEPNEALPIEISRGCIFKCSFCSYPLNGKKKVDYLKDPAILRDEFQRNYDLYGTQHYTYSDDTHNDSTQKLELLYDQVYSKLNFPIHFYTYLRLDLLAAHPEQIPLLKASGLRSCFFGIESLHEPSMRSIGKGLKPEKAIATLHKLREEWGRDITFQAGFITGLPHDTEETMRGWLDQIVDPSFPLDSIAISSLGLRPESRYLFKSELETNYAKYGYSFPDPLIPSYWVNSQTGIDQTRAFQIRNEYLTRVSHHKMAAFNIPMYLNLGYSLDDLLYKPTLSYLRTGYIQKKYQLADNYYKKLT